MEFRYQEFQRVKVQDVEGYNAWADEAGTEEWLRRIVLIVDELADLQVLDPTKELEGMLITLAQKFRAAGIHLVCATQRPVATVVSSQLKSQLGTRLCFGVSSASDSRVILDESGAELLDAPGDALLKWDGGRAERVQGVYCSTEEVLEMARSLRKELYNNYYWTRNDD